MADEKALLPLKKTSESIKQIKKTLTPFLKLLDKYYNQSSLDKRKEFDIQRIAEAEAAVALSIGTMRYMAFRLKGQERGKKKNDPLRMELDKMRKALVQVKSLRKEDSADKKSTNDTGSKQNSASKRKRIEHDDDSSTDGLKKAKKEQN
jgi:hypothetical protein